MSNARQSCCDNETGSSLSEKRKLYGKLLDLRAKRFKAFFILWSLKSFRNPLSYLSHFSFFHPTSRERRSSNSNAAGDKGGFGVKRNHIFIHRNTCLLQNILSYFHGHLLISYIHQDQVIVRSAGNQVKTVFQKPLRKRLCVLNDLL